MEIRNCQGNIKYLKEPCKVIKELQTLVLRTKRESSGRSHTFTWANLMCARFGVWFGVSGSTVVPMKLVTCLNRNNCTYYKKSVVWRRTSFVTQALHFITGVIRWRTWFHYIKLVTKSSCNKIFLHRILLFCVTKKYGDAHVSSPNIFIT